MFCCLGEATHLAIECIPNERKRVRRLGTFLHQCSRKQRATEPRESAAVVPPPKSILILLHDGYHFHHNPTCQQWCETKPRSWSFKRFHPIGFGRWGCWKGIENNGRHVTIAAVLITGSGGGIPWQFVVTMIILAPSRPNDKHSLRAIARLVFVPLTAENWKCHLFLLWLWSMVVINGCDQLGGVLGQGYPASGGAGCREHTHPNDLSAVNRNVLSPKNVLRYRWGILRSGAGWGACRGWCRLFSLQGDDFVLSHPPRLVRTYCEHPKKRESSNSKKERTAKGSQGRLARNLVV